MSTYSHRDHRSFRAAYRLLGIVAAATVGLVVVAFLAPWTSVGLLALLGLALLGGGALWASGMIADSYDDDLRQAYRRDAGPSALHVEVHSRVDLDRPIFVGGRPSPSVRRPRSGIPPERGPLLPAGERA